MPPFCRTREIMWRRVNDNLSFERARIVTDAAGAEISGTVLAAQDRFPLHVDYRIECDASWQTRRVHVAQSLRGTLTTIRIEHDGHGHWLKTAWTTARWAHGRRSRDQPFDECFAR